MRPVSAIDSSLGTSIGPERRRPFAAPAPKTESHALVPLRQAPHIAPRSLQRPSAAFLAHLIATKAQAPQTRARRRGEPAEAASAYAQRRGGLDAGVVVSRKM